MNQIEESISKLSSPDKNTRYEACEGLRLADSLPEPAIAALEAATQDPDPLVAGEARLALAIEPASLSQDMPINETPIELGFLLKWILVSTVGWIVFCTIGWGVAFGGDFQVDTQYITAYFLNWLVTGIIAGVIGGIFQFLIIRRRLRQLGSWMCAPFWVWSAILSCSLGIFSFAWMFRFSENTLGGFVNFYALVGLALTGVPQWFVLRRYVSNARWWLIVSPIGIFIALFPTIFYYLFILTYDRGFYWHYDISLVMRRGAILGAIDGIVYALLSAATLNMLLRSQGSLTKTLSTSLPKEN